MYGNRVKCKVVKNKVAPPFKTAEFDILYGKGISRSGEILDVAIELGIIDKSGSFFYYNGEKLAQGKDNVKEKLENDAALAAEIEAKVKANMHKMNLDMDESEKNVDDDDEDESAFDIQLSDEE